MALCFWPYERRGEPFVIEYNCRMGDPETEVVMPRLQTDLVALFAAMDNGTLIDANISYDTRSCATIMAVSGGYPGSYQKIRSLQDLILLTIRQTPLYFKPEPHWGKTPLLQVGKGFSRYCLWRKY